MTGICSRATTVIKLRQQVVACDYVVVQSQNAISLADMGASINTSINICININCCMLHVGDVPRVNGQLAVSRAFGDKSLKTHLRSDPDIHDADIGTDVDVLILASDGLWKVMHRSLNFSLYHITIFPLQACICSETSYN